MCEGDEEDRDLHGRTNAYPKGRSSELAARRDRADRRGRRLCVPRRRPAAGTMEGAGAGGSAVAAVRGGRCARGKFRSEEHTSELQSLMRISYAVFCLTKKNKSS